MKAIHIVVSGLVQGVNFRYDTKQKAASLGLVGFVKNIDSDDVEIIVCGDEEKINELIEWCNEGPVSARVDDVKVEEVDIKEKFVGFDVKY